jgi:hypothetical protein
VTCARAVPVLCPFCFQVRTRSAGWTASPIRTRSASTATALPWPRTGPARVYRLSMTASAPICTQNVRFNNPPASPSTVSTRHPATHRLPSNAVQPTCAVRCRWVLLERGGGGQAEPPTSPFVYYFVRVVFWGGGSQARKPSWGAALRATCALSTSTRLVGSGPTALRSPPSVWLARRTTTRCGHPGSVATCCRPLTARWPSAPLSSPSSTRSAAMYGTFPTYVSCRFSCPSQCYAATPRTWRVA